ncbi:B-cell lymphoma 3 protein homolog isoform X2 [Saccoglossus kowalevskii]
MAELLKKANATDMWKGLTYLHQVALSNKLKLVAAFYALCDYGKLMELVAGEESEYAGLTALELAYKLKNKNVAEKIIMHKIFQDGLTELHIAARNGDIEKVESLCKNPEFEFNVDVRGLYGNTPLYSACVAGKLNVVKFLLARGANLRQRNDWGDTLLHRSARWGQLEIVKYLIKNDKYIDIDAMNYDGCTPLHMAALYGSAPVVLELLQSGANPAPKTNSSRTPLHYALEEGHERVFMILSSV